MTCGSKKKTYANRTHNNFQADGCPVCRGPGYSRGNFLKKIRKYIRLSRRLCQAELFLLISRRDSIPLFRQLAQPSFGKQLIGVAAIAQAARAEVTSNPETETHEVAQG